MKGTLPFAKRNGLEILRDPLSIGFMLGFPLAILLLLTAIQANVPVPLFQLESLMPGIAVFGLSFIALFSGQLISKDRETSFLARLCASPLSGAGFIVGYTLPMLSIAFGQSCICALEALALGMPWSPRVLLLPVALLPVACMFIGIGMLAGTALNDKQVGGVCGALLANLTAWLSGAWFDLSLVGGAFQKGAYLLPFAHATDMGRAVLAGDFAAAMPHLWWVMGYGVVLLGAAIWLFSRKMRNALM